MMMLQLNPPIPVQTRDGEAMAYIVIDYGPDFDLIFVCFGKNGEIWSWRNQDIRTQTNVTFGRVKSNARQAD